MRIWQAIWIALMALSVGMVLNDYAKGKGSKRKAFTSIAGALIQFGILFMGGFFA